MRGKYEVIVKNARLQYKFAVERNITILRGDSATGKTTLIEMIYSHQLNRESSGVTVKCDKQCVVLTALNWKINLEQVKDSIVFIDEGDPFIKSQEFASAIKDTDNYYVIATRANLFTLPYSVKEIYGIKNVAGNRYQGTKRIYSEFYPLNEIDINIISKPDCVLVEDSNSGYDFFKQICDEHNIQCVSAGGKSNIFTILKDLEMDTVLVIADGAAFGPELDKLLKLKMVKNIIIYLPESFEGLILKSGLIKSVSKILEEPFKHIDSEKYFSWERFFTALLTEKTKESYLKYTKSNLNPKYLQSKEKEKILSVMPDIDWKI